MLDAYGNTVEKVGNIDTAISAEHARIFMEQSTGQFYIADGKVVYCFM